MNKIRDQSTATLEPDLLGEDDTYHLYFDKTTESPNALPANDEDRKASEYLLKLKEMKIHHSKPADIQIDSDLNDLSPAALVTLATKITKYGLQKTQTEYINEYSSTNFFRFLSIVLFLYVAVFGALISAYVWINWDENEGKVCITGSRCIAIQKPKIWGLTGLFICADLFYLGVVYLAFRAYRTRSPKLFTVLQIICVVSLVSFVLTLNVIGIPISSYLLFCTNKLVELSRKISTIEKFRSRAIQF